MKHWITIQNNVVRRTNITERLSIVVEKIVNYNEKLKEIVNGKALVENMARREWGFSGVILMV